MGAACCIAVSDRAIHREPIGDIVQRSFRHSPSWSFRRDSRVGVSGAATCIHVCADSAELSNDHSSLESYQARTWHKSADNLSCSVFDRSIPRNTPVEMTEESTQVSVPSSFKQSPSMHKKTSSLCESPLSSQSNPLPPSPARHHSSGRNSPVEDRYTPNGMSVASNESTQGSYNKSLDCWSTHAFSDSISTSQKELWSFDNEPCSLPGVKLTKTYPTCGICSKLLSEKSPWCILKFVAVNELSVISVLICGHLYHSECLETLTPEVSKYDPACPVCTFGEKQTLELTRKMLKAEKDLTARKIKKEKNQDGDTYGSFGFDYLKSSALDAKNPKLRTSSSLSISSAKPFLKRHFSFGSRGNKSASEGDKHDGVVLGEV